MFGFVCFFKIIFSFGTICHFRVISLTLNYWVINRLKFTRFQTTMPFRASITATIPLRLMKSPLNPLTVIFALLALLSWILANLGHIFSFSSVSVDASTSRRVLPARLPANTSHVLAIGRKSSHAGDFYSFIRLVALLFDRCSIYSFSVSPGERRRESSAWLAGCQNVA